MINIFSKFKEKLKAKMIKWLGIDAIAYNLKSYIEINDNYLYSNFKKVDSDIEEANKKIETLRLTLKSVLSVGADIITNERGYEHSWAVVCIEGDVNIVKFVDLGRKDGRYILDFLKQFDGGRMVIDTPTYPMLYDGLVFNKDFKKSRK